MLRLDQLEAVERFRQTYSRQGYTSEEVAAYAATLTPEQREHDSMLEYMRNHPSNAPCPGGSRGNP